MKEDCNLSIRAVNHHPVARNSEKSLDVRAEWLEKWVNDGMDYLKNCVFIDESGFDINMRRSRSWAARGPPVVIQVLQQKLFCTQLLMQSLLLVQ